jgi:hypothetical protein
MCFYVGNDVYHLRIFPIWRTYNSYLQSSVGSYILQREV